VSPGSAALMAFWMDSPGPTLYELALLVWSFDHFGYFQQRIVCRNQDRAEQDVLYRERV
jgi:hypothetical protein